MKLYRTTEGIFIEHQQDTYKTSEEWDSLVNRPELHPYLQQLLPGLQRGRLPAADRWLAPIGSQEVWASGVTYLRSRDARMEESKTSGGADFYQKVYEAERPEIFFKALPHKVVGPGQPVNIRRDSRWDVPEPELTLFINSRGEIQGYTIGNDMSSRSIEGENPLYLPQAKMYDKSAALGPCLYVPASPLPLDTAISIAITRSGREMFGGSIQLNRMKRRFDELAAFLYRANTFAAGTYLMTGTGIVPDDTFTLQKGDEISITVEAIGTLTNLVDVV